MNTLQIPVKAIPNFWGGDPITVQWGTIEDGEFEALECNHAGAEVEGDVQSCNKCFAWRYVFDYDFPTPDERWRYE